VRNEIDVDLVKHGWREAMLSNGHDGMKRMRLAPKGAALCRC
jgi:hypothetical protein